MALRKLLSRKEPKHPTAILAIKYDELLKGSQRQAALAREMSNKARRMIDHAVEMRGKPLRFVVR